MRRRKVLWPKKVVSCRKRRLDTGTRDSDEADDSSEGDASEKVEEAVVKQSKLQFSILKAGHHGSRTSVVRRCSNSFKTKSSFISWGSTITMGIPVQRLGALDTGAIIFRTDQDGQIRLRFTAKN